MRFPWSDREVRQVDTYTDGVLELLSDTAEGTSSSPSKIAALEVALGLWGRAFASAQVIPESMGAVITPSVLEMLGREVIRVGEVVFLIDVQGSVVTLQPASNWELSAGPDKASWLYEVTRAGPTTSLTAHVVSERRVIHAKYGVDPNQPWKGVGPLSRARTTAKLAANVETRLSEELGQSAGSVLPVPDGKSKTVLQNDLRAIKGKLALVESTSSGWGEGTQGAPRRDLIQNRIGANPPAVLATLRTDAALSVLAMCGVPTSVLEKTDGAGLRESWRQFLHASVMPVSEIISAELSDKLDIPIKLNFDKMFASDLSGRARAFQSMVGGGMEVKEAAALAGLMEAE